MLFYYIKIIFFKKGLILKVNITNDTMKNTKVILVQLTADDREQFILDNQWAFKHGAMEKFGMRDDHMEEEGEIITRATIEQSIDTTDRET